MSDGMANLGQLSKDMIQSGLNKTAQDLIRNLMINSPVDHGLLKQWAVTSQSDTEITIQSPAIYAAAQNYGTEPYDIYPKGIGTFHAGMQLTSGSALWWPGADHPVKHVHHPGLKAKHFVEDSIEQTSARIQEFFTINTGG
jgi:hypothetical protein